MGRTPTSKHTTRLNIPSWVWGLAVVVVVAALRLPWLEADAGNRGFYTYGFFTGDEGGYAGGGRVAYLTGSYLDPEMGDPHTFTVSWGMHWLSYWGYRLAGLGYGAIRWPAVVLVMLGWLAAYRLAARATVPWLAAVVTIVISCNPMSLTYERLASTDAVIGAMMITAYLLATSERPALLLLAGAPLALALSVKTTAVGLCPLLVLGLAAAHGKQWKKWAYVAVSAFAFCLLSWGWQWHCLSAIGGAGSEAAKDMGRGRVGVAFHALEWIRALAIFPRWPFSSQLGPFVVWLLILPFWIAVGAWRRTGQWCRRRSAVGWGLLLFVGMLATQAHAALRYFESLVFFVPVLLIWGRPTFPRARNQPAIEVLMAVTSLAVLVGSFWFFRPVSPAELNPYVHGEYVLPQRMPWALTWPRWVVGLLTVGGATWWLAFRRQQGLRVWLGIWGLAIAAVWLFMSNYVVCAGANDALFWSSQLLIQAMVMMLLLFVWVGIPRPTWRWWYRSCLGMFLAFVVVNGHWRTAYAELFQRTFVTRTEAARLAKILPDNAMVVGRRVHTLLRNTRCRLGLSYPGYPADEYMRRLKHLAVKYPERSLYWLRESDAAQWYYPPPEQMLQVFDVKPVEMVMVPADGSPDLIPVYLFRLRLKTPTSTTPAN